MYRVVFFLCLFLTFPAYATPNLSFIEPKANVNFMSPANQFDIATLKVSILHDLIVQLCVAKGDATPIFIDFKPVYFEKESKYTAIAYDTFNFTRQDSPSDVPTNSKKEVFSLVK